MRDWYMIYIFENIIMFFNLEKALVELSYNLFRLFMILNDGGIMFSFMQNCSNEIEAVVLVSFL